MATEYPSDKEVNPLLSEDPFKSEQSQKLFEAIDELRTCGANNDVDLPELVIVGDQSVGKSSLLQSLTDIPFPVAGRLCTRFPTLILSRRTPNKPETTKISIEPAMSSSFSKDPHHARVERYAQFTRESANITASDFVAVVDKATELMGITKPTQSVDGRMKSSSTSKAQNFSNDVLKIEISGPFRSYFSIIDVPGLFQSLTKDLTGTEKEGVKSMVASYMSRKQSIIVCVASGTNDLANQAAFDMASAHDPKGSRTVGVITKCDVAQNIDQVLELAQNKEKHFDHGWFVVRNRTPSEVQEGLEPLERHIREKDFFEAHPWTKLSKDRRGTQALKRYLAALLCSRFQANFPTILSDIQDRQDSVQFELDSLGTPRKTLEQKRMYLTTFAHNFNSLASQALHGRYDVISKTDMRLRTRVREFNDDFALDMRTYGHSTPFIDIPKVGYASNDSSSGRESASGSFNSTKGPPVEAYSGGSLFGGSRSLQVGLSNVWSSTSPFKEYSEYEYTSRQGKPNQRCAYQSISFLPPYLNTSFEELRLSDYPQAQPKISTPTAAFGAISVRDENPSANIKTGSLGIFGQSRADIDSAAGSPNFLSSNLPKIQTTTVGQPGNLDRGKSQIYQWIRNEVKASRGTELQGTLNPDVLPVLFHKQATNWRAKSEAHFLRVQKMTIGVTEKLLETTVSDKHTRTLIRNRIEQTNHKATSRGLSLLSERLNNILTKHLQTYNQAFEQKISETRLLRFQGALERYRSSREAQGSLFATTSDTQFTIDMRDTAALFTELHMSNSQNLEDEIHDILKAYYEIALNDFVEFVTQHVVERYLDDDQGPLLMLSPPYVGGLDDQTVENLAAENESTMRLRAELEESLARLNRAEEIAMKYT